MRAPEAIGFVALVTLALLFSGVGCTAVEAMTSDAPTNSAPLLVEAMSSGPLVTPVSTPSPSPSATPVSATPTPAPLTSPVRVPILMYHYVAPVAPSDRLGFNLTVTTGDFCRQLDYLARSGYTTITLAELFDSLYKGRPLPPQPVVLTFDDGYADAFTDVFPLLQPRGLRGTFAIPTGFIGRPGYLNWEQVRQMSGAGMEIASHTVTHIDLKKASDDTARQQLQDSRRTLEEQLGKPIRFFVYPSGEPFRSGSSEQQQAVIGLLREAGYGGALLAGPSSVVQDPQRPFELNRVRVSGGMSLASFAAAIGGPAPAPSAASCPSG